MVSPELERERASKEFELQGLLAALLLGVAGGGWYSTAELEPSAWKDVCVISLCVSCLTFMSAAIMAAMTMVLILTVDRPVSSLKKTTGVILWHAPKVYFLVGYLSLMLGSIGFLMCMISGFHLLMCLVGCGPLVMVPTALHFYYIASAVREDDHRTRSIVIPKGFPPGGRPGVKPSDLV